MYIADILSCLFFAHVGVLIALKLRKNGIVSLKIGFYLSLHDFLKLFLKFLLGRGKLVYFDLQSLSFRPRIASLGSLQERCVPLIDFFHNLQDILVIPTQVQHIRLVKCLFKGHIPRNDIFINIVPDNPFFLDFPGIRHNQGLRSLLVYNRHNQALILGNQFVNHFLPKHRAVLILVGANIERVILLFPDFNPVHKRLEFALCHGICHHIGADLQSQLFHLQSGSSIQ